MTFEPTDADVRAAIEAARWHAAHEQRWVTINAVLMSVVLLLAIVLGRPGMLAGAAWFALSCYRCQRARNREMLRLHRLGAIRWMGAPSCEYGAALPKGVQCSNPEQIPGDLFPDRYRPVSPGSSDTSKS